MVDTARAPWVNGEFAQHRRALKEVIMNRRGVLRASPDFDPAFATAAESADAMRNKRISATELMDLTFRRVDRHNPKINAIIWQFREQAMERARQADEMLAKGKTWGLLHGVPVTIKEAFAYQGSPNTCRSSRT
jgi:amidase